MVRKVNVQTDGARTCCHTIITKLFGIIAISDDDKYLPFSFMREMAHEHGKERPAESCHHE
ncbi:MAG: hypothetical protein HBSIN02_12440 [Bacteroidia bacterium]|nr:MAG: hypothetical protein HBSIN02_12440 [Bacteroidia bacterium]